jgi:hypothetical protein
MSYALWRLAVVTYFVALAMVAVVVAVRWR